MIRGIRLLACAGLLLAVWSAVRAAPIDGKWKLTVTDRDQAIDLVLLDVAEKDGKVQMKLAGSNPQANVFEKATIEEITNDKGTIGFTLVTPGPRFRVVAKSPVGDDAKSVRGVILIGDRAVQPIVMERTKEKNLDVRKLPGFDEVRKMVMAEPAEQDKLFKEFAEKNLESPLVVTAAQGILDNRIREDAKIEEIKTAYDTVLKQAAGWGDELVAFKKVEMVQKLLALKKQPELALTLVQELRKDQKPNASIDQVIRTTEMLAQALRANKKDAEADKLEPVLDQLFEKSNLNFEIKAFEGRKEKSNRVAVVELFTGAQCPPCVSADIAFDACIKAFKPTDAVFLQYHLHIPGPDALTNPDSIKRSDYYGEVIQGTPTALLNGKETNPLGGFKDAGEDRYQTLRDAIAKELEAKDTAKLKVDVKREGDKISIEATAEEVAKPGEKLKLRLVLIEDVAKYVGRNGQRLHHHVVRSFPGGVDGVVVKEKTATSKANVSITDLKADLTKYLNDYTSRGLKPFVDEAKAMELKKLKVVALLQDDESKEILQAIQVDVPEAK